MPKMLIRYALAAAIAGAGTPAWSAGIPDFGTKNFSPASDAPAYFSNESGAFFGAAASENEDGNDVSSSSMLATAEPDYSVSKGPRHHSRVAYSSRSASRGAPHGYSVTVASAKSTRNISANRYERAAHSVSAAQPVTKARAPKSGGTKLGRSGLHHASLKASSHNG
jgi:hypothetical protein